MGTDARSRCVSVVTGAKEGDVTQRSDREEFSDFAGARWPSLVRAGLLMGCSMPDAEDLAQTALTRCYQHWSRVARADNPSAYVHRMLVNAFLDTKRRRRNSELLVAKPLEGSVSDPLQEIRLDIERALGDLTPQQRLVVVLRYFLDLSERETAEVLGVPAGTVKSRLARALAALSADPRLATTTLEASDD